MSQANSSPPTVSTTRNQYRIGATVVSQPREPVSSYSESNKNISLDNIGSLTEREIETKVSQRAQAFRQGRFLKGPIPMQQIFKAAKLPGQALALFIAVHHQTALTGKPMTPLPNNLLTDLGISKDAKARGLRHLENAGLIRVERSTGRSIRVGLA